MPRHSVYYAVPRDGSKLEDLFEYLRSRFAIDWMRSNCQRAANGFLRLQSAVLKRLPVPDALAAPPMGRPALRAGKPRGRGQDAQLTPGNAGDSAIAEGRWPHRGSPSLRRAR